LQNSRATNAQKIWGKQRKMKIFPWQKSISTKKVQPSKYIVESCTYFCGGKTRIQQEEYIGIKNAMRRAHILAANDKSVYVIDGSLVVARFTNGIDTRFVWYPVN
jgi:hypothetical protein